MNKALKAVQEWAEINMVTIAAEKTEALLCTLDPHEGPEKPSTPVLYLGAENVKYAPTIKILGVLLDAGMRFTAQSTVAAAKLGKRNNILRSLAGSTWGSNPGIRTST